MQALKDSGTIFVFPVRNDKDWSTIYISNKPWVKWAEFLEWSEFMKALKATTTVPRLSWWSIDLRLDDIVYQTSDWSFANPLLLDHPTINNTWLTTESLPLGHEILSPDWINLDNNITPIVILPDDIEVPIEGLNKFRSDTIRKVLNFLDEEKVGTIFSKWEDIYRPKYLEKLKRLAQEWKIILIYNSWEKINQLDNSSESLERNYRSWLETAKNDGVLQELIRWRKNQ